MISLFDISLQLNGFPIKKAKTQLNEIRNLSEEQYAHFLQNRKEEIVAFHLENIQGIMKFHCCYLIFLKGNLTA
jgi:phenylacetate-CoA ligase